LARLRFSLDLTYQKRAPRKPTASLPSDRNKATYCFCYKVTKTKTCEPIPIQKYEQIIKVRKQTNVVTNPDGTKQPWIRNETWRPGCFATYIQTNVTLNEIEIAAIIAEKTKAKLPKPPKPRSLVDKYGLSEQDAMIWKSNLTKIGVYKKRLAVYKSRPYSVKRNLTITKCEAKIALWQQTLDFIKDRMKEPTNG